MSGKKVKTVKNECARSKKHEGEKSCEVQQANVERGNNGRQQRISCQRQIKSGTRSKRKTLSSRKTSAENFTLPLKKTKTKLKPSFAVWLTKRRIYKKYLYKDPIFTAWKKTWTTMKKKIFFKYIRDLEGFVQSGLIEKHRRGKV